MRDVVCRLCLKVPHEFILIDETSRQGLEILSVKINFDVSTGPLICVNCAKNIKRSLSFILVCLTSEKSILLLDTGEDKINIDLRDVCAYNSKEIVNADLYICRFCIKQVEEENVFQLDDIIKENPYLDMFKGCMFKMDLKIIKNPLICRHCRNNMESYFKFLWNCRDTEEKINTYGQNEGITSGEKVMLSNILNRYSKSTLAYPERQVCEVKKEEPYATEELTGIEFIGLYDSRENQRDVGTDSLLYQNGDMKDRILCTCDIQDNICLGYCAMLNEIPPITEDVKRENAFSDINEALKNESEDFNMKDEVALSESSHPLSIIGNLCICNKNRKNCSTCNSQFEIVSTGPTMYQCKLCPYQGAWIKSHMLMHNDITEAPVYKCVTCDFGTIHRRSLHNHMLVHKTEAEVTMYKCTMCDFKTKHRSWLKSHLLTHKNKAEVTMYRCTYCSYEAMQKGNLTRHLLTHKSNAEVKMYKCTACNFESKHIDSLKRHMWTHKTDADVVYKCTACDYKTNLKNCFRNHSLVHKTEAEVTMYKCTACDFKTKHKYYFKTHLLTHKTEAEVTMYKCTTCDFKTKHKNNVKVHSLIHKTEAEVTMYKCTACDFKTKRKNNLNRHLLMHKTEAELTMYKCAACDFMTKHKNYLKKHSLTHKSKAEVANYECSACDFKTLYKNSLKKHSLTHKTHSEVTMYKCTACDFETKHKNSVQKHLLTHKTKADVEIGL